MHFQCIVIESTTHQLAQSVLAASKVMRRPKAGGEQGEKCHQCGEFEVLHTEPLTGKASEYKRHIKRVWSQLADRFGSEVKNNERLCAHCALKRFFNRILDKNHILYKTFKQADSFPSTTEIALNSYFMREATDKKERKEVAQRVYEERTLPGMRNEDVYYAILMMDGDKMGDLVNGDTLASTWKSVLHPELVKRLETEGFNPPFSREWKHLFSQKNLNKRLVTPACHASISESLADFSLYGVAPIIQRDTQGSGRLIYAGGDDVCAVLPVQYALDVAQKIRAYYSQSFQFVNSADSLPKGQPIHSENWVPEPGKLSINLGKGDKISISAGILICHHKENLSQMIERAHQLLDRKAKSEGGRNACAIELRKRAGGSRYIVKKWDDKALIRFDEVGQYIADPQNLVGVSTSLVYRLEQFRPGIEAILQQKNWNDLLRAFLSAQLERSELKEPEQACSLIMDLIEHTRGGQRAFDPEPLIIAAFMSKTQKQK
ncbi:MAG: type III-B CRISPR-associated protein Cas10/Cmr2 [Acidobacteria bacterium]|nr:MAG: type III-B CRISPR-associated protein Cas10/Cmr2 [Acidobacteriota bacterium]